MVSLIISIRTLTPVWTGDVYGQCSEIKETGIIGNLRWWYESVVRSMGGNACDISKQCKFDRNFIFSWDEIHGNDKERLIEFLVKKYCIDWVKKAKIEKIDNGRTIKLYSENNSLSLSLNNEKTRVNLKIDDGGRIDEFAATTENGKLNIYDDGLCKVCRIFGATGWKKQFNLSILKEERKSAWSDNLILNVRPPERSRGWYLPPGKIGKFDILLQGNSEAIGQICSIFLFLESWGAIGSRSQLGYGFFQIINRDEVKDKATKFIKYGHCNEKYLPNLSKWIFFRCRFKPQKKDWWTWIEGLQRLLGDRQTAKILFQLAEQEMIPISPVLKNQWKYVQWQAPFDAKAWLLGKSTGNDRIKSKVAVSWAYRDGDEWVIRGWASLAENDKILNYQGYIESFEKILKNETIWRKALNLDSSSLKELRVISEKADIFQLLEEKHD